MVCHLVMAGRAKERHTPSQVRICVGKRRIEMMVCDNSRAAEYTTEGTPLAHLTPDRVWDVSRKAEAIPISHFASFVALRMITMSGFHGRHAQNSRPRLTGTPIITLFCRIYRLPRRLPAPSHSVPRHQTRPACQNRQPLRRSFIRGVSREKIVPEAVEQVKGKSERQK